ncbi:hypothetical protein PPSIR1_00690 [Plesiocystis pacifica SIR-1]|uniref:DUF2330 domain-containing protein n=1 Tax=Plesiocystis pacifica SIR-1 TaxID=391625 RepID=A6G7J6_9BACT|nr:DUF2330 domain-containing protein [Plesiocystis pacifica]EDM78205.1 hypothetical protein PPSIR1_00690 [Plesiocystis pacifica SIR-1]
MTHACGGTFCDNVGQPMPVDQSGEDILFVRDGTDIEVHVRIQYEGEAERFAWIVPIQAIPEVSVGSDPLFARLSQQTAPRWTIQRSYECEEDSPNYEDDGGGISFIPEEDFSGAGGPDVVLEETVGAFEVVVLQGGTAQEVVDFLDANDYAQDGAAEPILQDYIDEGFLLAAVKLTAGAEVEEIHPLSFRFQADEPCVPLRLTAIAAQEDMGVRAYFLDTARWAPTNYQHVTLNPLAYPWWSTNITPLMRYVELLSLAADEAGGRAFTTDYAGQTPPPNADIYDEGWDESVYIDADPVEALEYIVQQNLNTHPLVRQILLEYIPPPPDLGPNQFWSNIWEYTELIDLDAWDGQGFADALAERVIVPGMHAADLLDTWPYLTRLNTTISPHEMTVDPTFHVNPDLPMVAPQQVTSAPVLCGGDQLYEVAVDASADQGGSQTVRVCQPDWSDPPEFVDMPAALRIEQIPEMGPPQVIQDNSEAILASHAAWDSKVWCESNSEGGEDELGDDESAGGQADDGAMPQNVACACSSADDPGRVPVGLALGLLILAGLRPGQRRWRRRV